MTQRPQEPTKVPSDGPASPGRSVRVPALVSAGAAVVFALLGFLGAAPATGLTGALVLGGGLLAGAAAVPRAGRVTAPGAVVATVGMVGVMQAVATSRGGGALLLAAAAVALLTWIAAVVAAMLEAGAFGARAPRPAAAPVPAPPAQAPAWAPVEGWQPSAYPADPTMTYVGQPTGQQAFAAAGQDATLVGRVPGAQLEPTGVPLFGVGAQPGGPEPTAVFGVGQAGEPKPAFGQSSQTGASDAAAVFGSPSQAATPDSAAGYGQSPQAGGPDSTAVFGQTPQTGAPGSTGVFGPSSPTGTPESAAAFGAASQTGAREPAAAFGTSTQAGTPDPTAVFGQSPQAGALEAGAAFGAASQTGAREPAAAFGQSPQRGVPESTAVFGKAGAPEAAGPFGGAGEAKPAFGQSSPSEPAAAFGAAQPPRAGGPEPTAVIAGPPPQGGTPESARPGAPTPFGQPPTGTHRAPTQEGGAALFGLPPSADQAPFTGRRPAGARSDTPGQPPTGAQPTPDVPLFGAAGLGQATSDTSPFGAAGAGQAGPRPGPEAPQSRPFGLAGTGQAASSAHHEPVQDASAFDRAAGREVPLFGVSGVGQASSAHHEPVQDASAYERPQFGPVFGGERGQDTARPQTGAHRAPGQDGSAPPFGGRPGRNGSTEGHPAQPGPARAPDAQGYGLFGGGPASGAHRAPSETGSWSNGRPVPTRGESGPHRAPTSATNGSDVGAASRGVNGASRDGAVPSQRAGTEASGPSYQQAARRRRADGESPPFVAATGGDAAQPSYGRPGSEGREAPLPGRRSAEQRPAEQGGGDADPSPETTAFPVQHAPTADPAPAWRPPPAGQDDTMVASPGWLGAGQPAPDGASPPVPRRAARHGEGRHGEPER